MHQRCRLSLPDEWFVFRAIKAKTLHPDKRRSSQVTYDLMIPRTYVGSDVTIGIELSESFKNTAPNGINLFLSKVPPKRQLSSFKKGCKTKAKILPLLGRNSEQRQTRVVRSSSAAPTPQGTFKQSLSYPKTARIAPVAQSAATTSLFSARRPCWAFTPSLTESSLSRP